MKYTLLAIIVACVVIFIASGCAVYYPTSPRAFIPKQWDSEYKEYQRLCKEEIGKVVYARDIQREIQSKEKIELMLLTKYIRLGEFIYMILMINETRINDDSSTDKISYLYVGGFTYYTGWTQKSFSMHDDSKNYIICEPLLYGKDWEEEHEILNKMAFENKEYIGKEYEKTIFDTDWTDSDMEYILRKATNFKTKESK